MPERMIKMEIKLKKDEVVANYGGDIEGGGFENAAFEAAVVELSEKIVGWDTYEVNAENKKSPLVNYKVNLLNEEGNVKSPVEIDINTETEEVCIEVDDLEVLKALKDKEFTTTSGWVEENDPDAFIYLLDMLREFERDEGNMTTHEDVESFEKGEWLVNYFFTDTELRHTAGRDGQHLNNQDVWVCDSYQDIVDNTPELIKIYTEEAE